MTPTSSEPKPTAEKVILGIDPGTNVMGYGLLEVADKKPRLVAMGALELSKVESHYLRLRRIFDCVVELIEQYHPDELAIESPFLGINVQSMVKLCRAQGVAMAAAVSHDLPVFEYAPMKAKMAITGNGGASKEQVSAMLCRILHIAPADLGKRLDATDALGIALCHFYETSRPLASAGGSCKSWKDFMQRHPDKVRK
jgi:crossover junction endodeoxyribonuclease RuvC